MDTPSLTFWSDCRHCGLLQLLPPSAPGFTYLCRRCHNSLGSGVSFFHVAFAFALCALVLFVLAQCFPLMSMTLLPVTHSVHIASGMLALADHTFAFLALWLLAIVIAAPMGQILCLSAVFCILPYPSMRLRAIPFFRLSEKLRFWVMLDVLLLAAIVASSKLRDMAQIDLDTGFWALALLVAAMVMLETSYDPRAIWNQLKAPPQLGWNEITQRQWAGCILCGWLQPIDSDHRNCCRCGEPVRWRKPRSLQRTWALIIAGCILYIPANLYPVLTTVSFYDQDSTTIIGGVRQLADGGDWLLAAVLFTASIVIPFLKLAGLAWLIATIHLRSRRHLIARTRLYHAIRFVGKWANVDIFVGALLTGLVMFGNTVTIMPAVGALAFGAVVVLTMAAAECFDPRLLWDAAGKNEPAYD